MFFDKMPIEKKRNKMAIGRLKKVELREIWSREDTDFTNWLNDNLDILGEAIGLELEESETESSWNNSDFRVDISATTKENKKVIIENQLEKTDHKHLGQIMTYMINMESEIAVWVAKEIRHEHIKVIDWLNEFTDKDFYLIQLESYQIDNSIPAPFFKVICKPSIEMRKRGEQKIIKNREEIERNQLKINFWRSFLEKVKNKTNFFSNDKPHWWTNRYNEVEKTGVQLGCCVNKNKVAVSVLFNLELKEKFFDLKKSLESEIGFVLEQKDNSKSRGFAKSNKEGFLKWFDIGGYRSPENEWDQIQEEMIDHFVKLEKALKPILEKLKLSNKAA